jgi:hypothetical protein
MSHRVALFAALILCGVALASTITRGSGHPNAYRIDRLVSDKSPRARTVDGRLVNAWGVAASPTGPWWTANEASASSTLYDGAGRKQSLTVSVAGGPTGVVYHGGDGFRVAARGSSDPARFVYACEDGMLRAWTPTVPTNWSRQAVVVVDEAAEAAVFRGIAIAGERIYATDFHNARVEVFDSRWHRVVRHGAFVDRSIPDWYAPFGIRAIGNRVFVTYVWRAPVNGNDAPTGGYVDEFDLAGTHLGAEVVRALRRRPPRGELRRRPHQRLPAVGRELEARRHPGRRTRPSARRKRALGPCLRKRRERRLDRHALLHVGAAPLAWRNRARRARAPRRDHDRRALRELRLTPRRAPPDPGVA